MDRQERYHVGKEIIVRLIAGGKVTIPEEVRIAYNIEKGDILVMEIKEVIKPKSKNLDED